MASYAVTDETAIHAHPSTVWGALHAEFRGETDWWMPYWEAVPRGGVAPGKVGAEYDIQVHPPGRLRRLLLSPRFTARVMELIEDRRFGVEFHEGDFSGTGEWTLPPVDDTTRLRFD